MFMKKEFYEMVSCKTTLIKCTLFDTVEDVCCPDNSLLHVYRKRLTSLFQTHIHTTFESFCKYLPISVLPKDYGGEEASIQELHGKTAV